MKFESVPNGEVIPALHTKIDTIRSGGISLNRAGLNGSPILSSLAALGARLEEQYGRQVLWNVPAWHKLAGGSQQPHYIESDHTALIEQEIDVALDEIAEQYNISL